VAEYVDFCGKPVNCVHRCGKPRKPARFELSNSNGNPDRTAFAFNLGGGAKYYLSKNFGLRGDIRYMPTYANSTPSFACDIFGNCFNVPSRNFENRVNFSGGIILRF
jgi:hypothetical protein